MCGSPVAQTLKRTRETQRSIMVRAFEPYVQQYSVLPVQECPIGDYNGGNRENLVGDRSVLS
jgi:hypothetical protein